MKQVTIVLPDDYDQVVSITAIGVNVKNDYTSITNVITRVFEVKDKDVIIIKAKQEGRINIE